MIRTVIVDDEEKSRKLLRNLLAEFCRNVEVMEMADSVKRGVEAIRKSNPDLVFLDIVMPNQNGFELLDEISDLDCEIIFTTAYDQYAIKAIRVCALDYLLKPIDVEELQAAVTRVQQRLSEEKQARRMDERLNTFLSNLKANEQRPQKIGIPTQHGVKFYPIEQINYCKAEGNYTTIYLQNNGKLELVCKTLKEFEELLAECNFVRAHRSYLVNLNHVKEYRRNHSSADANGEGGCLIVDNNARIPVSRDKRKVVLDRLAQPF